jgi:hypothetical protein
MDYSINFNTFTSQKVFNYDKWKITTYGFYDEEYSGWRWSVDVNYPGGCMASGGYGLDNEIIFKTYKDALEYAIEMICGFRADGKELRRDMRLKLILDL